MKIAQVRNGVVVNIIKAQSMVVAANYPDMTCVDLTGKSIVYVGATYDGVNFINPPPPAEEPIDPKEAKKEAAKEKIKKLKKSDINQINTVAELKALVLTLLEVQVGEVE